MGNDWSSNRDNFGFRVSDWTSSPKSPHECYGHHEPGVGRWLQISSSTLLRSRVSGAACRRSSTSSQGAERTFFAGMGAEFRIQPVSGMGTSKDPNKKAVVGVGNLQATSTALINPKP